MSTWFLLPFMNSFVKLNKQIKRLTWTDSASTFKTPHKTPAEKQMFKPLAQSLHFLYHLTVCVCVVNHSTHPFYIFIINITNWIKLK